MSRRLDFSTANTTWYVAPSIRHPVRDCSKEWHRPKTKHTFVEPLFDMILAKPESASLWREFTIWNMNCMVFTNSNHTMYGLSPIRSFNIYHARLERYRHLHVAARMTWFPRLTPFLQQSRASTYTEHMGHSWIQNNEIQGTVCIKASPTSPENVLMKGYCGRRVFIGLGLIVDKTL